MQECVATRKCKFLANYVKSDNILCYVCQNTAAHELNMLGKRWLFHKVVCVNKRSLTLETWAAVDMRAAPINATDSMMLK